MYHKFIGELQKDVDYLKKDPEFTAKEADLEKFKQQEMRKFEKTVKRELNEVEDIFSACGSEKSL